MFTDEKLAEIENYPAGHCQGPSLQELAVAMRRWLAAVVKHHGERADDRCWLSDNELYEAFGLELPDRRVGDRFAMIKNCVRFLEQRCAGGGPWKSYRELEIENADLKAQLVAAYQEEEAIDKLDVAVKMPHWIGVMAEAELLANEILALSDPCVRDEKLARVVTQNEAFGILVKHFYRKKRM